MAQKRDKVDETVIQIDEISGNNVNEITKLTQKLLRTNQILLEQARDPIWLQLKSKNQEMRVFRGNSPTGHSVKTAFE